MSKKFIGKLVDSLGHLLAQQAELNKAVNDIKKKLKAEGVGAYEGDLFRVTVAESISYKLDMDAVRGKLSDQFIRAHSFEVKKVDVRCVARNNEGLQEAA